MQLGPHQGSATCTKEWRGDMGGNRTNDLRIRQDPMLYHWATMPSWEIWSKVWSYIFCLQNYVFCNGIWLVKNHSSPKIFFDNKKNHPFILHVRQNLSIWAWFEPTSSWCQELVLHHWATLPSWENKQNWLAHLVHCGGFIFLLRSKSLIFKKFVFYDGIWHVKNYWRIWSPKI